MARLTILIPPANKKKVGGNPFAPDMFDYRSSSTFNYFSRLNVQRRALIDQLHSALEAGEEFVPPLDSAPQVDVLRNVYSGPLMSSLERYSAGRIYSALDFQGLPTGAQRRLLENGVIFSGMFGILRPDDLIPEYYLPMSASVPKTGAVADYWKPIISPILNPLVEGSVVWDLLPDYCKAAWDDEGTYDVRIFVRFVGKNGEELEESAAARIRGKLVGFLAKDATTDWEALKEWRPPIGFHLSEDFSQTDPDRDHLVLAFARR